MTLISSSQSRVLDFSRILNISCGQMTPISSCAEESSCLPASEFLEDKAASYLALETKHEALFSLLPLEGSALLSFIPG